MENQYEVIARWLWDYIPQSYRCNPLSVSSHDALAIVARYAWEHPDSELGCWYRQASDDDRAAFQDFWYSLCSSLR